MLSSGSEEFPQAGHVPKTGRGYAVAAGILGWTLDAFDFFVVVFMVDTLAENFGVGKGSIILTLGATLAMRPVGALVFGILADRYGRRQPLMAVVAYFSLIEICSGLAPSFPVFFVLRALYGIGMGGFWGVGASLTLSRLASRVAPMPGVSGSPGYTGMSITLPRCTPSLGRHGPLGKTSPWK